MTIEDTNVGNESWALPYVITCTEWIRRAVWTEQDKLRWEATWDFDLKVRVKVNITKKETYTRFFSDKEQTTLNAIFPWSDREYKSVWVCVESWFFLQMACAFYQCAGVCILVVCESNSQWKMLHLEDK